MRQKLEPVGDVIRRALGPAVRPVVDARLRPLTSVNSGLPPIKSDKTKPFGAPSTLGQSSELPHPPSQNLSPRQLAAARLLARGMLQNDVARELRMTRQGLWKWRRMPAFAAELQRLHERLLVAGKLG
jgi:hypothetical protein